MRRRKKGRANQCEARLIERKEEEETRRQKRIGLKTRTTQTTWSQILRKELNSGWSGERNGSERETRK